jgi:aminotransferase
MIPFEEAQGWVAAHGCPYSPNAGFNALREAIAKHYAYKGLGALENVCVTVGSQEALYVAIKALLDPAADEVLIVSPSYPAYPKICRMEGIAFSLVPLSPETGFAPDAEAVLSALSPQTRLVLLASPANPTGRVWPRAELEKLAAGLLATQGPAIYVLMDEVYRELNYGTETPFSLSDVYKHTLVANSLSKSHALTGLRLGWLMAPETLMPDIIKVHQFVNTAASTFSQQVALSVFRHWDALGSHRKHYFSKREALLPMLDRHALAYVAPEGAFYCMIQLPEHLAPDSTAAAYRLLEDFRVVTVPGAAFDAEGWLRVSWVSENKVLDEGLGRIATFFDSTRP